MSELVTIENVFFISLLITLVLSVHMFISVMVFKHKTHATGFSTWQMPMLFALFMVVLIYKK